MAGINLDNLSASAEAAQQGCVEVALPGLEPGEPLERAPAEARSQCTGLAGTRTVLLRAPAQCWMVLLLVIWCECAGGFTLEAAVSPP